MSIRWRLEVNTLTTPQSYSIRFVPRKVAGREDLAADIALRHPNFNEEAVLTILKAEDEAILARLLNGEQVTKEGSFSYYLTFTGRVDNPEDPLPPLEKCLHISVRVSQVMLEDLHKDAQTEQLGMNKKLPQINLAFDSLLKLNDVLNGEGVLQLTGDDLFFDQEEGTGECVIEGTREGRVVQSRFVSISNSTIQLMPDIPSQTQPWNNEYKVSISTRSSEHGTLRTGSYSKMLRTPLGVSIGNDSGILNSTTHVPLVTVSGGTLAAEGARVRIQVLRDVQDDELRFNLLDMKEGGMAGDYLRVAANGTYTLLGWPDCDVTSLEVTVADYAALYTLVRHVYGGRLVDILDVSMGT